MTVAIEAERVSITNTNTRFKYLHFTAVGFVGSAVPVPERMGGARARLSPLCVTEIRLRVDHVITSSRYGVRALWRSRVVRYVLAK